MKYLVDTNVWMEVALARTNFEVARDFLTKLPSNALAVSDFTVNSFGFFLAPKRPELVRELLLDLIKREIRPIALDLTQLLRVLELKSQIGLDYDDCFQYAVAELYDLQIVSFDSDFDRTPRGRLTPAAALEAFSKSA